MLYSLRLLHPHSADHVAIMLRTIPPLQATSFTCVETLHTFSHYQNKTIYEVGWLDFHQAERALMFRQPKKLNSAVYKISRFSIRSHFILVCWTFRVVDVHLGELEHSFPYLKTKTAWKPSFAQRKSHPRAFKYTLPLFPLLHASICPTVQERARHETQTQSRPRGVDRIVLDQPC